MRSAFVLLFSAALAALAGPASAQFLAFDASSSGNLDACVSVSPGGTASLYVFLAGNVDGVTGVDFSVATSGCPGVTFLGVSAPAGFIPMVDGGGGIQVAFGGCVFDGSVEVARLDYLVTSAQCCEFQLMPGPSSTTGKPEALDCNFNPVGLVTENVAFISTAGSGDCSYSPPPTDPGPADGATGVALDPSLEFGVGHPHACRPLPLGILSADYYLGTTPDPPLLQKDVAPGFAVGPLDPKTTYYWKVVVSNFGYTVDGPVWSFTTTDVTAAEHQTWGAIKALYKE